LFEGGSLEEEEEDMVERWWVKEGVDDMREA